MNIGWRMFLLALSAFFAGWDLAMDHPLLMLVWLVLAGLNARKVQLAIAQRELDLVEFFTR